MSDEIDGLIAVLFASNAREDEKDDAALDLRRYPDERALQALIKAGSNPSEDSMVLDTCGESIASILVHRDECRMDIIERLDPIARRSAYDYIMVEKPTWLRRDSV